MVVRIDDRNFGLEDRLSAPIKPGLADWKIIRRLGCAGWGRCGHWWVLSAVGKSRELYAIQRAQDIAPAFERLKGRAQALDVLPDPLATRKQTGPRSGIRISS